MRAFRERYGPWALITGASSGLGEEFANQLAVKGMNLILLARRKEKLKEMAERLGKDNRIQVESLPVDLARLDFMSAVRPVTQEHEVGLLVNNAGFGLAGEFLANELGKQLDLLNVNCRAPLILAHELGREMVRRKRGGIIFLASTVAHLSAPLLTHYAASKAYNLFLGEGLWYELKRQGVDVLALCPGETRTEFHRVAGMRTFAPMPVEPVVSLALKQLGRRPSAIAGWRNRLMIGCARLTPRWFNITMSAEVLKRLRAGQKP